jgi:hypothetical protein
MSEKGIVSLDAAQVAAERFLEDRLKNLKKISVDKVRLISIEGIVAYDVEGIAIIGTGLFSRNIERPFKVQVGAIDASIIGFET